MCGLLVLSNLNKLHFFYFGVPWLFLGSYLAQGARTIIPSLVSRWSLARGDWEGSREDNLNKKHYLLFT
jgi:hypothetical protein